MSNVKWRASRPSALAGRCPQNNQIPNSVPTKINSTKPGTSFITRVLMDPGIFFIQFSYKMMHDNTKTSTKFFLRLLLNSATWKNFSQRVNRICIVVVLKTEAFWSWDAAKRHHGERGFTICLASPFISWNWEMWREMLISITYQKSLFFCHRESFLTILYV